MEKYTIKQMSEMFHLTSATLRYYEDMGLLSNVSRNASGHRIYNNSHINRLKTINCFKSTGMTISQLQKLFSYENDPQNHIDDILFLLETQKNIVSEQLLEVQKAYEQVADKILYFQNIKKIIENKHNNPNSNNCENA